MTLGAVVWSVIGGAFVLLVVATAVAGDRLPSVGRLFSSFLSSWAGRILLLCGWAEVGWHLFCQHP